MGEPGGAGRAAGQPPLAGACRRPCREAAGACVRVLCVFALGFLIRRMGPEPTSSRDSRQASEPLLGWGFGET